MGIDTGFGPLTIGKDVSADIVLPSGQVLRLGNITGFDRKPMSTDVNSKGIDGVNRFGNIPDGWDLSFNADREDSSADDYYAQVEADYYAGKVIKNVTVYETITEVNGSITQYRYEGCSLKYTDAGSFEADKVVKTKWTGKAARRTKIA
jgi:hypothetical protein